MKIILFAIFNRKIYQNCDEAIGETKTISSAEKKNLREMITPFLLWKSYFFITVFSYGTLFEARASTRCRCIIFGGYDATDWRDYASSSHKLVVSFALHYDLQGNTHASRPTRVHYARHTRVYTIRVWRPCY